ncbi:unnamed protein product [Sphagnum balticum]
MLSSVFSWDSSLVWLEVWLLVVLEVAAVAVNFGMLVDREVVGMASAAADTLVWECTAEEVVDRICGRYPSPALSLAVAVASP